MKLAVVTCYDQNDYVRATTMRAACAVIPNAKVTVIRNTKKGLLRYPEVMWKILKCRVVTRPDVYVVTFRGYEMLLYMSLTFVRKPIVFDELINMTESFVEHGKIKQGTLLYRLFRRLYAWLAGHASIILADTDSHAALSAELNHLPVSRYVPMPVAADETVFYPRPAAKHDPKIFIVFYYATMIPLHGLPFVLEAAEQLAKTHPAVQFWLVGGSSKTAAACAAAVQRGAHIKHELFIPFGQLPDAANAADLVLAGPFGGTEQAQHVVTGKTYQFMAMARPVVVGSNKVNGMFADRDNCLLVDQASSESLAAAISWAVDHRAELSKIGQAGYDLYTKKFSQEVVNQQVADILSRLAKA